MKRRIVNILAGTALLLLLLLSTGQDSFAEDGTPWIKEIKIKPYEIFTPSYPPAIGCASQQFSAETILTIDGEDIWVANEPKYNDYYWKVERYDNVNKTYTTVRTAEGDKMYFWMPYGTEEGQYKVTATSKVDSDASGFKWYRLYYPWYTETFCMFYPGKIKYGKITTKSGDVADSRYNVIRAKDIKETYNWDTEEYRCILPQSPYKAKDYTFFGWRVKTAGKTYSGKIYKAKSMFVAKDDVRNVYFEAQWKPNFKAPDVVANKAGKKKIRLSWNRMVGGNGYKIYRSTKKGGKYKRVKTVKNRLTTSWTDKKVKAGKKYYYKVAPFKKGKMKKSAWVLTSTKAAKVRSVKLNRTSVKGKVGETTKLNAKVITAKGKKLSKKVRWYTSNKKIAKISQKTGKVTFVKAGACQVWAKAYNGKNSTKINVTVLAK